MEINSMDDVIRVRQMVLANEEVPVETLQRVVEFLRASRTAVPKSATSKKAENALKAAELDAKLREMLG